MSLSRRIAARPVVQLVVGALVVALAFPGSVAGSLALGVLGGALGAGIYLLWPHMPAYLRAPTPRSAALMGLAIVAVVGLVTFMDVMTVSPDWQMGDWGPQRTALAHLMPSLPGVHAPVWDHTVSTGDAPFELYPSFAYFVAGHLALALGLGNDLPLALMITAVLVHVSIAVLTTAIAMEFAPKPLAVLVGIAALLDGGAVAHGGAVGLFRWALLHSAMSLAFGLVAALGILRALRRPTLRTSAMIWIGTALAVITHPAGLLGAAASIVALGAVALLASDVPRNRPLAAIGHIAIGLALGAFSWMPLAARILAYGEHFPNGLHPPGQLLIDLLALPAPVTWFALLGFAGYFGVIAGLWSRRASLVFAAAVGLLLLVGLCEEPYLALGLMPSESVARLGVERLAQIARPYLGALAAYGLAIVVRAALVQWKSASRRQALVAAALIGVMCCVVVRILPAAWEVATTRVEAEAHVYANDPVGRATLQQWAAQQMRHIGPGAWARAYFEEDTHEQMHVTATTGLPTFHLGPIPDMLLRERIEDVSEASLERFDVRWAIGIGKSPSIGNPKTELQLGEYRVREIDGWDGKFARIEAGEGTVTTTRLDSGEVDIDVQASGPVLVALGTGYYPRWRATHASGADEPVYALPTIPGGKLHVVSAWVAPGVTRFTCDGPLPSDGKGRFLSILAALVAIGALVGWRRIRWRALRRLVRLRARIPWRLAAPVGVPVLVVILLAKGCLDAHTPVRALRVGSGLRAAAEVEARVPTDNAPWTTCDYERVAGEYSCDGLVVVYDATARLLNDSEPSWAFLAPAITAVPDQPNIEIRVRVDGNFGGTYLAGGDAPTALWLGGERLDIQTQTSLDLRDADRTIEFRALISPPSYEFAFVRADALDPPRPFLVAPPPSAPAAIAAIH
ncbi:MAG TPA: hypothetical protein VGM88_19965 [Kofleriaceae bacterium]